MIIPEKLELNWEFLKGALKELTEKLHRILTVRKLLVARYPVLQKDAKDINRELKAAKREKNEKKMQIEKISKLLRQEKEMWITKLKQTEENLYLNHKAQVLMKEFEKLNVDRAEVIIHLPKRLEEMYAERKFEVDQTFSKIKAVGSQIKCIQREMDKLQTVCVIKDWHPIDNTHYFDEYCEFDIVQISIRREKEYYRHTCLVCKVQKEWYYILDGEAGEKVEPEIQVIIEIQLLDWKDEINLYKKRVSRAD